jgi:TPR repeat protein
MSRATPASNNTAKAAVSKAVTTLGEQNNTQPVSTELTSPNQVGANSTDASLPRMATLQVSQFPIDSAQILHIPSETPITHTEPQRRDQTDQTSEMIAALNAAKSIAALKEAAWSGDAVAQFELGARFYGGSYVQKSYKKAFEMFCMSAKQGCIESQFNLGVMYELGHGVKKDVKLAAHWFYQAAIQGNSQAQSNLGMMYNLGDGVEQNDENAVLWDSRAAEQGHAESQFNLAYMYQEGRGVQQSDTNAARWYRKSADQGFAKAQCNLGVMYDKGEGIEQDESKAVIWYTKAASKNNKDAQFNLVENYIFGHGVKKDLKLATYFLIKFGMTNSGKSADIIDFVSLVEHFPFVLSACPEFINIKKIIFKISKLKKNDFYAIGKFIRENTCIEKISFHGNKLIGEDDVLVLTQALPFNTVLTELNFNSPLISMSTKVNIANLLKKNSEIVDLREYMAIHHIHRSDVLPYEVLTMIVDQMIIAYLKGGESKQQTINAIEEFLACICINTLEIEKASELKT